MPHRIRLRGFWDRVPAVDGGFRHSRLFGRPRTLDPGESVWLTGDGLPGLTEVAVNGHNLGIVASAGGPFAFDVTPYLQIRNELVVTLSGGGEIGDVALEIRGEAA